MSFCRTPLRSPVSARSKRPVNPSHHPDTTRMNSDVLFFSDGRDFANMYSISFIEASPGHPCPAPFPTLLSLVRQYHEASTSKFFGEGAIDFFTVAAARVFHVARPHLPTSPLVTKEPVEYHPHIQRRNLPASFSAPRCGSFFLPRFWHFPCILCFRPSGKYRQ